ncbi:MAG TPA: ABC transporter substrate-binding protein [Kofleriaceae bacterium]|nr:ABC transporter substrate-binding protein [Kofleriaceae bacterium]
MTEGAMARVEVRPGRLALALSGALAVAAITAPALADTDRVVLAINPPTAETNLFWAGGDWSSTGQAMEPLVGADPITGAFDNSRLAESWENNADFTEWTFRLREGVPFHHGYGEVTAEDVVHSYALHTGADVTLTAVEQMRGAEVTALDRYTVRFTFEDPRQNFLFLNGARGSMYIYSKAQYDKEGLDGYNELMVGTGHYRFVERTAGRILYERVEDHYSGIVPDFREMELRFVAEPATKLAMLLTGEAHIADLSHELMPDALDGGMEIIQSVNPTMQTDIVFNGLYCTSGDPACRPDLPWADVRIREAINRALDRETMAQVLFDGRAEILVRHAMKEGHEGYDPTLEERFEDMYGYDPDRARELMAEAGYPDAFPDPTIPLVLTEIPGQPEIPTQTELVQVYLEEVGFQTEIREIDHAGVGAAGRGRQAYFLNPIRNAPIRPTEVAFRAFYTNPGGPYQGWEDDWTEAKIQELIATRDPEARDGIAREIFNYLFEQYNDIPLFEVHTEVAVNREVVAGWTFPGVTSAGIGHWHLIEAAN